MRHRRPAGDDQTTPLPATRHRPPAPVLPSAGRVAAALAELAPPVPFDQRAAWRLRQLRQALGYLYAHPGDKSARNRAAVILRAEPWHPLARRVWGAVAADYDGQQVKCVGCKRRYVCTPEDPYLEATTRANGICTTCLFLPAGALPAAPAPAERRPARRPKVIALKVEKSTPGGR